jgi:Putative prokaryotic signal transducing protein
MGNNSDLVVVKAFATQSEAEIAKTALESAGIVAMIKADTVGGMRPHIGWSTGGFQLLVREEDLAESKTILEGTEEQSA